MAARPRRNRISGGGRRRWARGRSVEGSDATRAVGARWRHSLAALLFLCGAHAGAAITVTDDAGRTLTLPRAPQRIVSLAPGATEMLFAAGAGALVIATVEFSDEPPQARKVPRIGDANSVDMERLVALRPDVVVVWEGGGNAAQIEKLAQMRMPLYRQKAETLAAMPASLRRLGELTGTREAAALGARDIESRLEELTRKYGRGEKLSVLLEVWNRPIYTVGGTHLMSDSLRLCGARNVFDDLSDLGPAVDVEAVIARDPDVIVAIAPPGSARDWLSDWQRFKPLRAVRDERLVPFEDARLSRLGPSAVGGTEALCEAIDAARRRSNP
jgi:iron complex transport system substrate-binding protein